MMNILVLGTPDSGKSKKAEDIVMSLSDPSQRVYIATMIPFGEEGQERIKRHKKLREGKGFVTIEKQYNIDQLLTDNKDEISGKTCLLECMSNLVGNEMHLESNGNLGDKELTEKITDQVMKIAEESANLVIVSNRFEDDDSFDAETKRYVTLTNKVNDALKEKVDQIYELVKGEWVLSEHN